MENRPSVAVALEKEGNFVSSVCKSKITSHSDLFTFEAFRNQSTRLRKKKKKKKSREKYQNKGSVDVLEKWNIKNERERERVDLFLRDDIFLSVFPPSGRRWPPSDHFCGTRISKESSSRARSSDPDFSFCPRSARLPIMIKSPR